MMAPTDLFCSLPTHCEPTTVTDSDLNAKRLSTRDAQKPKRSLFQTSEVESMISVSKDFLAEFTRMKSQILYLNQMLDS